MSAAFRFTAETNLQEAIDLDPRVVDAFHKLGLKCFDCAAAPVETLREAARYHEKNLEEILSALQALDLSGK